ncbi:MAG: SGNH/GDSL hydrolase family protein [bacterium]|nr:SGNH/GDSL hydrolase family protein [bacterium]
MSFKAKTETTPLKPWKRRLFSAVPAIFLTIAVLALELGLRLAGHQPLQEAVNGRQEALSLTGYFWITDPYLGFKNRPNGRYENRRILTNPLVTTDRLGYRNGSGWSDPDTDEPIVLFVGDSTTFCAEVNDDETGPSEVARLLAEDRPIPVLNAGVRGYSTLQSRRMLELTLRRYPSIQVAIYTYSANDYLENLNPIVYFPAKAPVARFSPDSTQLIAVEVENPTSPWGQSLATPQAIRNRRREIEETHRRVAVTNFLRSHSVLAHELLSGLRLLVGKSHASRGIIGSGPEGGFIGPLAGGTPEWDSQEEHASKLNADLILIELLRQMQAICRASGAAFFVTPFTRGDNEKDEHEEFLREVCRRADVHYVDLRRSFVEEPTYYAAKIHGGFDGHYGHQGTKTYARALVPEIIEKVNRRDP